MNWKLAVMNDLVTLTLLGVRVVLVHGGGPAINQMLKRVGKESKFVNGLRYTDEETMGIVQQVLAGQVNKDLVALLKGRGVGLCGMDGHMIMCKRKSDVDLGYVGEIEKVNTTLIDHLLADSFIPVIATVGMDDNGIPYNINADTAAAEIAIALHAEKLVSMTDIVGLLYDKDDESTLIPEVEVSGNPRGYQGRRRHCGRYAAQDRGHGRCHLPGRPRGRHHRWPRAPLDFAGNVQ